MTIQESMRKLDFAAVKEACTGLEAAMTLIPSTRQYLKEMRPARGKGWLMSYTYEDQAVNFNQALFLPQNIASTLEDLKNAHMRGELARNSTIKSSAAHEMGHAANLAMTRALGLSDKNINKVSELFVKDVFQSLPEAERAAGLDNLRRQISKLKKYALKKPETLSEAINDFVANGAQATVFSKALVSQAEEAISGKDFLTRHILSKSSDQLIRSYGVYCLDAKTALMWYRYQEAKIPAEINAASLTERIRRAAELREQYLAEAERLVSIRPSQKEEFRRAKALIAIQSLPAGEYNLTIRRQVQARHIEGTREYSEYVERLAEKNLKPSKLLPDTDVQILIKEFHGKGIYNPNPKDNSPREKVDTGRVIGQYWDKDKNQYADTSWLMIVYSKRGTHIYPIRPEEA